MEFCGFWCFITTKRAQFRHSLPDMLPKDLLLFAGKIWNEDLTE